VGGLTQDTRGVAASKNTVVELLLTALRLSELKDHSLDALGQILKTDPRIAVLDGTIDLQPVWELLDSEEGFELSKASPPFCVVKVQEARLGLTVKLPNALAHLSPSEVKQSAATLPMPAAELERALTRQNSIVEAIPQPIPGRASQSSKPVQVSGRVSQSSKPVQVSGKAKAAAPTTDKRKIVGIVATAVAAVSLLMVSVPIGKGCAGGASPAKVAVADFAGELPLASANQLGSEIVAELSDGRWIHQPADARRSQLGEALRRLSAKQVSILNLTSQGKLVASVQWKGSDPYVRFY
jgi:hypothetical protein